MNACTAGQVAALIYMPCVQHCVSALARCPILCKLAGQLVAVRLAFSDRAQCAAHLEAAAYKAKQELQGCHVLHLVVYGCTCGRSAYCVATAYIKVHCTLKLCIMYFASCLKISANASQLACLPRVCAFKPCRQMYMRICCESQACVLLHRVLPGIGNHLCINP